VDKQWEDFVRFNLLLEHLKDAIEIIDATQRKRLFSKLGNWQPTLAQEQETKAPKTERKEQLRLDVGQMINRAVDRANKRANGQR
jgi:hypothetical protein